MESRKLTIIRSITYRAAATVALAIITWIYTGDMFQTSIITVIYTIAATAIYYFHERLWMMKLPGHRKRQHTNK